MSKRLPLLDDVLANEADERNAKTQLEYHGPGLVWSDLEIGALFEWPAPIPRGPEPMRKTSEVRYDWSRGYGSAEAFYRVERWPRE